ncbi:ataxin-2-like [Rhincodon typus]|uniref:ataxin-2-like n=1 Tax=Rhincodon typus TaxID=259920 RepID=UPI00202E5272|nr:ataxin-2-like [Rhincodon typus]
MAFRSSSKTEVNEDHRENSAVTGVILGIRGRSSGKGPSQSTIPYDGIYANMRMVHILTSVVGAKCELKVKNGGIYEGVFKTYSPKCDLVLDAAHRKNAESSSRELGPKREDIVESIIFKSADVVMLHFKDVDLSYARRGIDFLTFLQIFTN